MDEIKNLLNSWEENGFINPEALKDAYDAIILLVAKVEELEAQIEDLTNP